MLSESARGGSRNTTVGAGVGTGAAGNGSYQQFNFGALIGVSGGFGDSTTNAFMDAGRQLSSSSVQTLRDRTLQSASAVRNIRSTLVQTATQGEVVSSDHRGRGEPQPLPHVDHPLSAELIEHLNANLEYYHHAIWWTMDPNRRFMLLDGYEAPNVGGRSVASVVDNSLIGIVGNSLVMPVALGEPSRPAVPPRRRCHAARAVRRAIAGSPIAHQPADARGVCGSGHGRLQRVRRDGRQSLLAVG